MTQQQVIPAEAAGGPPMVFTFGIRESVLDRRELSSYFEVWHNNLLAAVKIERLP